MEQPQSRQRDGPPHDLKLSQPVCRTAPDRRECSLSRVDLSRQIARQAVTRIAENVATGPASDVLHDE